MRRLLALLFLPLVGLAACGGDDDPIIAPPPPDQGYRLVSAASDDGAGSLRSALADASSNAVINTIEVDPSVRVIRVERALEYSGAQTLRIVGNGVLLDATGCDCDALTISGGADVDIERMRIRGALGNGITSSIPESATGTVALRLEEVWIIGTGLHGVHIDDRAGGDDHGADSPATIRLELIAVEVRETGYRAGFDDIDGIRLDEGGVGSIELVIAGGVFETNAGDGVKLDERDDGDVIADIRNASFDRNGEQPQLPEESEGGLDMGEAGTGSIDVRLIDVTAVANFDEGIDLDEEGAGDIRATLTDVISSGNTGANVKLTEDADAEDDPSLGSGGIIATFQNLVSTGSGDDGVQLEEFGSGDLSAQFTGGRVEDNRSAGIEAEQLGAGSGTVQLNGVAFERNVDGSVHLTGTRLIEVGAGGAGVHER